MADEFAKWDAFMRHVDRCKSVDRAFQRYKSKRRRRGRVPVPKPTPLEQLRADWAAKHEQNRIAQLQFSADKLAEESAARAGHDPVKEWMLTRPATQPRPNSKLTNEQVIEARQVARSEGLRSSAMQRLAFRCGVAFDTLLLAAKGLTFKHLNYVYPPAG